MAAQPTHPRSPRAQPRDAVVADPSGAQALAVTFEAEVLPVASGGLCVAAGASRFDARRAASCLVEPQPGDRVACWRSGSHGREPVWVIAVLQRAHDEAPLPVALGTRASVQAGEIEVRVQAASFVYRTLHAAGELLQSTVAQVRWFGSTFATCFDRQAHHAKQHVRTVEGLDLVDAQLIEQRAKDVLHLQGGNLLAEGERLVKVRGGQIHLG